MLFCSKTCGENDHLEVYIGHFCIENDIFERKRIHLNNPSTLFDNFRPFLVVNAHFWSKIGHFRSKLSQFWVVKSLICNQYFVYAFQNLKNYSKSDFEVSDDKNK